MSLIQINMETQTLVKAMKIEYCDGILGGELFFEMFKLKPLG